MNRGTGISIFSPMSPSKELKKKKKKLVGIDCEFQSRSGVQLSFSQLSQCIPHGACVCVFFFFLLWIITVHKSLGRFGRVSAGFHFQCWKIVSYKLFFLSRSPLSQPENHVRRFKSLVVVFKDLPCQRQMWNIFNLSTTRKRERERNWFCFNLSIRVGFFNISLFLCVRVPCVCVQLSGSSNHFLL